MAALPLPLRLRPTLQWVGWGALLIMPCALAPTPARSADAGMIDARQGKELAAWRLAVAEARLLAENDVPRARAEAQRLLNAMPTGATARDHAAALNALARTEVYAALLDAAANHAQSALKIATKEGDPIGQAEACLNIALNTINQGNLDILAETTLKAVSVLKGVDRPALQCEALLRAAMMYRRFGKIEESVTMSVRAQELAASSKDSLAATYAHQALALSYLQSDHRDLAEQHYRMMLNSARAARSKLLEADAMVGVGTLTAVPGQLPQAEQVVTQALELYREVGAPFSINVGLINLANTLRLEGRYEDAIRRLDEVIAIYHTANNRIGLWYTLSSRSDNLVSLGRLEAATVDAEKAYALARDLNFPIYVSDSALRLATLAAKQGDYRKAFELSTSANDVSNKAAREKISARVIEVTKQYEEESRQREIVELQHRNAVQRAQLHEAALYQRVLWGAVAFGLLALAGTSYFTLQLRRSHRLIQASHASLERRVEERTAELQVANKELEAFSYSVSHDLRAPLRSINGFSRILLEDNRDKLSPDALECVVTIRAMTQRMGQLIDDMLVLARVTRAELHRGPVNLSELATAVMTEIRQEAPDRAATVTIAPGLMAAGDSNLLRAVLQNLLANAWKFSGTQPQAQIEVGRADTASGPAFFVRDNGVGFDPTYAHKLFKPFQRLHTRTEFPGTGVGLATVHRIVSRHGGRVWAESSPDQGATFYFTLPIP